jgi:hypothetical protein
MRVQFAKDTGGACHGNKSCDSGGAISFHIYGTRLPVQVEPKFAVT